MGMMMKVQFSLRRLFVATTLIAFGCGEIAFLLATLRPPPIDTFQMVVILTCGPISGAGLLTPFKRPILGAILGFFCFMAILLGWHWPTGP
jgi:hypothetical protein